MKWMLEEYEPGILLDPDVNIAGYNEPQILQCALDQLLIPYENAKAILGLSGYDHSLSVLLELSERVI